MVIVVTSYCSPPIFLLLCISIRKYSPGKLINLKIVSFRQAISTSRKYLQPPTRGISDSTCRDVEYTIRLIYIADNENILQDNKWGN